MGVQYPVVKALMSMVARTFEAADLNSFGVSQADFKKLVSPMPWASTDRGKIQFIINSLLSTTMTIQGVAPFQLSAEYIAAGIALWIHPMNIQAACRFMERVPTAEALGRKVENTDLVNADQLKGLVDQYYGDQEHTNAIALFEKFVGVRLQDVRYMEKKGGDDGTQRKK